MSTSSSCAPGPITDVLGSFTPRAVVFDCDGILLDTQALWDRSIDDLLTDRGVSLPESQRSELVGATVEFVVLAIANAVDEDPHAVGHEMGERYKQLLGGDIPVLPGVRELVDAVGVKVPVAVASNTPRRYLMENLCHTGLLDLFDHVVGADDVAHGKPAPDIYERACALLNVDPEHALAFEDSDTGADAARAAGMTVIAAPIIPGQNPRADATVSRIGAPSLLDWVYTWPATRPSTPSVKEDAVSFNPLGSLRHFYPSGVVFDCDGLILDTESVWEGVQHSIMARHGVTPSPEIEQELMGTTLEQAVEILARLTGQNYEPLLDTTRTEFSEAIEGELTFMPGAKEFVELVASKVPIACASNSWHSALESKLTRAGLIHLFDNLQSADTVAKGKPAPDMYAQAARELGFEPHECLAFEDSPLGARAAKSAGLTLIGVPSSPTPIDSADVTVTSLEDSSLVAWVSSWPNRK